MVLSGARFFLVFGGFWIYIFRVSNGQNQRPNCRNNIKIKRIFMGQICSNFIRDTFTINIDPVSDVNLEIEGA